MNVIKVPAGLDDGIIDVIEYGHLNTLYRLCVTGNIVTSTSWPQTSAFTRIKHTVNLCNHPGHKKERSRGEGRDGDKLGHIVKEATDWGNKEKLLND